MEKLIKVANAYWDYQRARVLYIAAKNDIEIELKEHDDEFLYDLFDCGDMDVTDDRILEELMKHNS